MDRCSHQQADDESIYCDMSMLIMFVIMLIMLIIMMMIALRSPPEAVLRLSLFSTEHLGVHRPSVAPEWRIWRDDGASMGTTEDGV